MNSDSQFDKEGIKFLEKIQRKLEEQLFKEIVGGCIKIKIKHNIFLEIVGGCIKIKINTE